MQNEIQTLKKQIAEMGDKFVQINMPSEDTNCVYITYFKCKIYVGYNGEVPLKRIDEIKSLFNSSLKIGDKNSVYGQISLKPEIKEDYINLCKIVAYISIYYGGSVY